MTQLEFQREILAFDEKISLSKLEVAKAEERVKELEYQKSRFQLDFMTAVVRENAQQQPQQPAPTPTPGAGKPMGNSA